MSRRAATASEKVLNVLVATVDQEVYRGEARMVTAPGSEGEFSVLPRHARLLTSLKPGILRIYCPANAECEFGRYDEILIYGGFIEVQPYQVIILADAIERAADIDTEKTMKAIENAKRMLQEGDPAKIPMAHAELELDLARMRIARHLAKPPPKISD